MWSSLFSRDPTRDFPYEFQDKTFENDQVCVWTVFRGVKKGSGEAVSIFTVDVKSSSEIELTIAKECMKRLKSLRHPNILTYLDGLETDKTVYMVTEYVKPLNEYLSDCKLNHASKSQLISWGLFQLLNALKFLTGDAKLVHNNVNSFSVFVNSSGDWKVGGFEFVVSNSSPDPASKPSGLQKYCPPEHQNGFIKRGKVWSTDMWGFATVIWECFNGCLANSSSLKQTKSIPSSLTDNQSLYRALISAPEKRPSPAIFLELCRKQQNSFMRNNFVDSLLFLDEIQIKESREKNNFFGKLNEHLDQFPDDIALNKILPQLINAYEYGNAGSGVLAPLFKIGRKLDTIEYQKKIVPCVVKLFSSNDRSTRVKLLQQIDQFVEHLQTNVVNDKIFPSIISGFMDTNPAVRENTVKAMVTIAPKLNYNNLNVELMKHFARLQGKDDEGGIRTNTTVCLGKIGSYLHSDCRQKILISAFARATKDPFPPARSAGILAFIATQQFYPLVEVAHRILPALCSATVDCDKNVRDNAFKAIDGFIQKLSKASDNPNLVVEMESEVRSNSGGSGINSNAPSWAGWAISAISTKFYKSQPVNPVSVVQPTLNSTVIQDGNKTSPTNESISIIEDNKDKDKDLDGWGDLDDEEDWGDIDESNEQEQSNCFNDNQDNDDSDWGINEDCPIDPIKTNKSTINNNNNNGALKLNSVIKTKVRSVEDDIFAEMGITQVPMIKHTSQQNSNVVKVTSSAVDTDDWGSCWDEGDAAGLEWDSDVKSSLNTTKTNAQRKSQLEQKRKERQDAKRQMKLGTKKL